VNAFGHGRELFDAERGRELGLVGINTDTLYSWAQVDVGPEPVILAVPEAGGRYYVGSAHGCPSPHVAAYLCKKHDLDDSPDSACVSWKQQRMDGGAKAKLRPRRCGADPVDCPLGSMPDMGSAGRRTRSARPGSA
jgi:Protein of unknown function (DUF1254)